MAISTTSTTGDLLANILLPSLSRTHTYAYACAHTHTHTHTLSVSAAFILLYILGGLRTSQTK